MAEGLERTNEAPPRLPIVIGVCAAGPLGEWNGRSLIPLLHEELGRDRSRFPHSPVAMLVRESDALIDVARAAAAGSGADLIELSPLETPGAGLHAPTSDWLRLEDLARRCHVLIRVSRSLGRESGAGIAAPGLGPGNVRMMTGLEREALDEPSDLAATIIDVRLGAEAGDETFRVSRSASGGTAPGKSAPDGMLDGARRLTDEFNRDAAELRRRSRPNVQEAVGSHRSEPLHELHALSDELAMNFQERTARAQKAIVALSVIGAACYGAFLTIASGRPVLREGLLGAYLLLLAIAYAVFFRARRQRLHERFLQYRAFAEGLRVQRYWRACGLQRSVADLYLERHPAEYHWIRLALRALDGTPASRPEGALELTEERARSVLRGWIEEQGAYFDLTSRHGERAERRMRRLIEIVFAAGVGATVLVLLQIRPTPITPFLLPVSFLSFLCPSLAAALIALVNQLGIPYRTRHYSRMLSIYSRAARRLADAPAQMLETLALEVGRAALRECGEWTLFRGERRIDEPSSPFRRPK